ncbi:hypothetical protein DFH08DRAFT_1040318 [Mycena albidolilacea]|uniref:Uncharacterized protein n=1 Tax=Mycena albidolilacea TaxID=1033008 RepID=A0AAD6ZBD9_9AGAR|nr:hypothetical protein DFH08DRAFT_1040318 [Mycena albidolilacea]
MAPAPSTYDPSVPPLPRLSSPRDSTAIATARRVCLALSCNSPDSDDHRRAGNDSCLFPTSAARPPQSLACPSLNFTPLFLLAVCPAPLASAPALHALLLTDLSRWQATISPQGCCVLLTIPTSPLSDVFFSLGCIMHVLRRDDAHAWRDASSLLVCARRLPPWRAPPAPASHPPTLVVTERCTSRAAPRPSAATAALSHDEEKGPHHPLHPPLIAYPFHPRLLFSLFPHA